MAKITPKENFLRLAGGGMPAYVPYYNMQGYPDLNTYEVATMAVNPNIFNETMFLDGGYDMWGVRYAVSDCADGGFMPVPNEYLMEDVTEWERILKFPEIPDVDWERKCAADLAAIGIDRNETALICSPGVAPFTHLINFMGFEEGLMALCTDPDAVKDMLNAMIDFLEPIYTKIFEVYKPDLWMMADDTCAKTSPFFSVKTYEEIFKPLYMRLAKPAIDNGVPVLFHICGRCEDFIPHMLDFGVKYIEPAQTTNNLHKIKEDYKGKLSIIGAYDWDEKMPKNYPNFDEEEVRQGVRDVLDKYAPGGGFGFTAHPLSFTGDPALPKIRKVIRDEVYHYGKKIYGYKED